MLHYDLTQNQKYLVNLSLIILIITIIIYFIVKKYTSEKMNKEYNTFFKGIYSDFIKYLCIEIGLTVSDYIESGNFILLTSLSRISVVLIALVIYHEIKYMYHL